MRPFPVLLLPVLLTALSAQTPEPRPVFDVTSVKPRSGSQQFLALRPIQGGVHLEGPLRVLIRFAHGVQDFQLEGASGWMDSEYYVVEGKAAGTPTQQETNRMLQALLEDRFTLKMHCETKEGPVYSLVVARGGSKLKPSVDGSCVFPTPGKPPDSGTTPCGLRPGPGTLDSKGVMVADLTDFLSGIISRPVVDRTALTGRFDFHLEYAMDQRRAHCRLRPGITPTRTIVPQFSRLSSKYLGLQLRPDREPPEFLVIDGARKPAAN